MSDTLPAIQPPEAPKPPPLSSSPAAPASAPAPGRGPGVVLTALALALLAGGVFWVVAQQQDMALRLAVQEAEAIALREEARAVVRRVVALEGRPMAAAGATAAATVDLRPLEARLAALEGRPVAEAGPAPAQVPDAAMAARIGEMEQRLAQGLARAELAAARGAGLARVAAALEAGRPLGVLAGAPAALARYASVAPPTEAGLRLGFEAAARAARAASRPAAGTGVVDRLWLRLGSLVTVREGDAVLLGSPAAGVLGVAGGRLSAGDLAGAVAALDGLDEAAAAAMAGWREQAMGLLAARAALSAMLAE